MARSQLLPIPSVQPTWVGFLIVTIFTGDWGDRQSRGSLKYGVRDIRYWPYSLDDSLGSILCWSAHSELSWTGSGRRPSEKFMVYGFGGRSGPISETGPNVVGGVLGGITRGIRPLLWFCGILLSVIP